MPGRSSCQPKWHGRRSSSGGVRDNGVEYFRLKASARIEETSIPGSQLVHCCTVHHGLVHRDSYAPAPWCTPAACHRIAPCTSVHQASKAPAPRCMQPYCTECAPAPRCIPALLNVSLTLGQHCNSTKKTSEASTEIDTAFLPFLHLHAPRCTVHRGAPMGASPPVCTCTLVHHGGWRTGLHLAPSASHVRSTRIEMLRRQIAPGCMVLHQL